MEIIKKGMTPDGVAIQLEKWDDSFQIGAYPVAVRTSGYWIKGGEVFRLTIAENEYMNYSGADVVSDFGALMTGEKTLADLKKYFWRHDKDIFALGL